MLCSSRVTLCAMKVEQTTKLYVKSTVMNSARNGLKVASGISSLTSINRPRRLESTRGIGLKRYAMKCVA